MNEILAAFERETSTQVVLYVAARLPAGATLEEVAAQALGEWGIGQKGKDNGVLFLAFLDDRVLRIEVGYGLEGALRDARAHRIVTDTVTPRFRQGDFTGGIEAAAARIMAAFRGEPFQATGQTVAETRAEPWPFVVMLVLMVVIVLFALVRGAWRRPASFSHPATRRAGRATVLLWASVLIVAPLAAWKMSPVLGYVALVLCISAIVAGGIASALEKRRFARVRSIVGRVAFVVAACALPALLQGLATGGQDRHSALRGRRRGVRRDHRFRRWAGPYGRAELRLLVVRLRLEQLELVELPLVVVVELLGRRSRERRRRGQRLLVSDCLW